MRISSVLLVWMAFSLITTAFLGMTSFSVGSGTNEPTLSDNTSSLWQTEEMLTTCFYENIGQCLDIDIQFYGMIPGGLIGFGAGKVLVRPWESSDGIILRFVDSYNVIPQGACGLDHLTNFFLGDRGNYRDVRGFGCIVYENLWDGIDLVYEATSAGAKYEFRLQAEAEPNLIRIRPEGQCDIKALSGRLEILVSDRLIVDDGLMAFQGREEIEVVLYEDSEGVVGFELGEYDKTKPLVIDPLLYSTYIGGSSYDQGSSVAIDSSGYAYITGETWSSDFPIANPFQPTPGDNCDCFVLKLNTTDNSVLYSTYVGGLGKDCPSDIEVDSGGNVYVSGYTESADFPVWNAYDSSLNGTRDCFVFKLNSTGNGLNYSTYIGGSASEMTEGDSLAVDGWGNVHLAGYTSSADFPTVDAYDGSFNGLTDCFLVKLSSTGNQLSYSTFIGGTGLDYATSVTTDSESRIYLTGLTNSSDFPVLSPIYPAYGGAGDAFLLALNLVDNQLNFSTYLGGSGYDLGTSIQVDSEGGVYATGYTTSEDYPLVNAVDSSWGGPDQYDCFVIKVASSHDSVVYSTWFGHVENDVALSLNVDSYGRARIAGWTQSRFFTTKNAFDSTFNGQSDCFVFELDATGGLLYSTFVGGSDSDSAVDIAFDSNGVSYVVGSTRSVDFPTVDAYSNVTGGGYDSIMFMIPDMGDSDNDGVTDYDEIIIGIDQFDNDTDNDLMPDGWEVTYSLNPSNASDASEDRDSDGLTNIQEFQLGTDPSAIDSDGDGVSDGDEVNSLGTNPRDTDTEDDGMPDGWEVFFYLDPLANDSAQDPDLDALGNLDEYLAGTSPRDNDSDDDTMPDGWEVFFSLNPLTDDSSGDEDSDTLTNDQEYLLGTSPRDSDSDDDSVSDNLEVVTYGTDPANNDTDTDGMPDGWEISYLLNPLSDDAFGDQDSDGLTNIQEYLYNSNPRSDDSDSDGLSDGEEVFQYGSSPLDVDSDDDGLSDGEEVNTYNTDPTNSDSDSDGIEDYAEIFQYNTDPMDADSDNDGFQDGEEVNSFGSDPLDPNSPQSNTTPHPPPSMIPPLMLIAGMGVVFAIPTFLGIYISRRARRVSEFPSPAISKATAELDTEPKLKILGRIEIVGGRFDLGVSIENDSPYVSNNIVTSIVAYPDDCLELVSEATITTPRLEPRGRTEHVFSLSPTKDCVEGQILTSVSFVDHENRLHTIRVEPQLVRSVCDLLTPMEASLGELEPILETMTSTEERRSLKWNPQVLFAKAKTLLPRMNFSVVDTFDHLVGNHFEGTIRGFAKGKYTGSRIAVQLRILGPMDAGESNLLVEALGDDISMLPTTVEEVAVGLDSWTCLACGAPLDTKEVTIIRGGSKVGCRYCGTVLDAQYFRGANQKNTD